MEERVRDIILQDLLSKGITHSQDGTSVHEMNTRQLKELAALVSFREIDVEASSNAWF